MGGTARPLQGALRRARAAGAVPAPGRACATTTRARCCLRSAQHQAAAAPGWCARGAKMCCPAASTSWCTRALVQQSEQQSSEQHALPHRRPCLPCCSMAAGVHCAAHGSALLGPLHALPQLRSPAHCLVGAVLQPWPAADTAVLNQRLGTARQQHAEPHVLLRRRLGERAA